MTNEIKPVLPLPDRVMAEPVFNLRREELAYFACSSSLRVYDQWKEDLGYSHLDHLPLIWSPLSLIWLAQYPLLYGYAEELMREGVLPRWTFRELQLQGQDFIGASFNSLRMVRSCMDRCDLSQAHIARCNLAASSMREAELRSARVEDSELHQVDLTGARLRRSRWHGSRAFFSSMIGADLTDARFV